MQLTKEIVVVLEVLVFLAVLVPAAVALEKVFIIQETDLVNVKPTAIDPDQEEIAYGYGIPLNASGQWQTSYDDAGEYGIEITATDGVTISKERIILTVTEKNRPPQIAPVQIIAKEGEKIALSLPEKDLDGESLSYIFNKPFNSDGEWATTHNDAGEYSFFAKVTDGKYTAEFKVDIFVTNVDRPLFMDIPAKLLVNEGEELVWEIDAVDPDGDAITIKFAGLPEGAAQEQQHVRWTPSFDEVDRKISFWEELLALLTSEQIQADRKSFVKEYPVAVTACSSGSCQELSMVIIVTNVNQKPLPVQLLPDQTADHGLLGVGDLNDVDIDSKNPDVSNLPGNLSDKQLEFVFYAGERFRLNISTVDPDGDKIAYSFSPPLHKKYGTWKSKLGDEGEYLVNVTISDGIDKLLIPARITVLKSNRQPELKSTIKEIFVNEGQALTFTVKASDPDQDGVVVSLEEIPPGARFNGFQFSWTPNYDLISKNKLDNLGIEHDDNTPLKNNLINKIATINGALTTPAVTKELLFTAFDGTASQSETVIIHVRDVNQKPEIIDFLPEREFTATVGEPVIFNLAAKDLDHDPLDYQWSFSLQEPRIKGTNVIERTFVTPGKKKVTVKVTDGLETAELTWKVKVIATEISTPEMFASEASLVAKEDFTKIAGDEPKFNVYVINS